MRVNANNPLHGDMTCPCGWWDIYTDSDVGKYINRFFEESTWVVCSFYSQSRYEGETLTHSIFLSPINMAHVYLDSQYLLSNFRSLPRLVAHSSLLRLSKAHSICYQL